MILKGQREKLGHRLQICSFPCPLKHFRGGSEKGPKLSQIPGICFKVFPTHLILQQGRLNWTELKEDKLDEREFGILRWLSSDPIWGKEDACEGPVWKNMKNDDRDKDRD